MPNQPDPLARLHTRWALQYPNGLFLCDGWNFGGRTLRLFPSCKYARDIASQRVKNGYDLAPLQPVKIRLELAKVVKNDKSK